ncbi:glycosyltransferase [Flavitalea antarctica]
MLRGVSVIICCYNSSQRLPATFKHLLNQHIEGDFGWEIIVVDNASRDQTWEVAQSYKYLFHEKCLFTVVSETVPGLTNARKKGVAQATFDHILFCDDDNWLSEDYLAKCFSVMQTNPQIGVCGGRGIPVFETEKPIWFDDFQRPFAVGKSAGQTGCVESKSGFVTGAGMFLSRKAWNKIVEAGFESILSDRKGTDLSSGGDLEICFVFRMAGYQIYYIDEIYFQHFIPKERLSIEYLTRLHKGIGKANVFLSAYEYIMNRMDIDKSFIWARILIMLLPKMASVLMFENKTLKQKMEGVSLRAYFMELAYQRNRFDAEIAKVSLLNQRLMKPGTNVH